ncbi:MAG: hypothetical protein J5862_04525 [Bacteroidales bacterium]|nr:hypothetical protein [Bacteroidales bacterium]
MNKLKERVLQLLGNKKAHIAMFFVYYVLMTVEYWNFVCRNFPHLHFHWTCSAVTVVCGFLLLAALAFLIFKLKPSSSFAYALSVFVAVLFCVPAIIFFQFGNGSIFPCIYSLLFTFLISSSLIKIPTFPSPVVPQRFQVPVLLVLALLALIPFVVVFGFDVNFNVFSMGLEIYDVRAAARARTTTLTAYLFGPLVKVLLPLLLVYGVARKKWLVVAFAAVAMLYIFLVNPHKAVFLSLFLVLIFCLFDDYNLKAGFILFGVVLMVAASALVTLVMGNILPESILVRRMFFVPAQLSSVYFSFFENNHIYLSHSVLKHFFDYPYELDPPHLIGWYMYGRTNVSCNTGFIGDGYMNFGHFGALLFTLGTAVVFRFFESVKMRPLFFGVVLLTLFTFLNSAFLTSLLTHGVFFFMLIALFFLKTDNDFEK